MSKQKTTKKISLTEKQVYELLLQIEDGTRECVGGGHCGACLEEEGFFIDVLCFCESEWVDFWGDYWTPPESHEVSRCGFIERIQADLITDEGIEPSELEASVIEAIERVLNTPSR